MPTLTWVGKDKVVNHHHEVPFRVFNKQYALESPEASGYTSSLDDFFWQSDDLQTP